MCTPSNFFFGINDNNENITNFLIKGLSRALFYPKKKDNVYLKKNMEKNLFWKKNKMRG